MFQERGLEPSVSIFLILYFGITLVWPWRGARFLYTIQPFLFYYFLQGIGFVAEKIQRLKFIPSRVGCYFVHSNLSLVIVFLIIISLYKGITDNSRSTQYVRDFQIGTIWLRENSPIDAVIMAEQPQSIYLYSQRKTVEYTAAVEEAIEENAMAYILVAPRLEWREDSSLVYSVVTSQTLPLLSRLESMGRLTLVYQSSVNMVQVYEVQH